MRSNPPEKFNRLMKTWEGHSLKSLAEQRRSLRRCWCSRSGLLINTRRRRRQRRWLPTASSASSLGVRPHLTNMYLTFETWRRSIQKMKSIKGFSTTYYATAIECPMRGAPFNSNPSRKRKRASNGKYPQARMDNANGRTERGLGCRLRRPARKAPAENFFQKERCRGLERECT